MTKRRKAYWSESFQEYITNKDRILSVEQYEFCLNEWIHLHGKRLLANNVVAILLLGAGLWALYEHALMMAVVLLALAANFQLQASNRYVLSDIMGAQRLLAMLINKQSRDIESLRKERS